MKIYRTRQYRVTAGGEEILWSERYCTSRRQYAFLKKEISYYGITRIELHAAEIPGDAWQLDQVKEKES